MKEIKRTLGRPAKKHFGRLLLLLPILSHALLLSAAPRIDGQDKKMAARVEELIRGQVSSPLKGFKVVVTPSARSERGYFSSILIEGQAVQIKKLRLAEFWMQTQDIQIDTAMLAKGKIQTIVAQTRLRAVVTEDDLTAMLAKGKDSAQMGLTVKYVKDALHGDVLRVSGNWAWSWFRGPFTGIGKLRLAKNNQVYADIISLQMNGREVPAFIKNKFSAKINPILDYNDVPFQPQFRGVKVEGSRAILSA